MNILFNLHSYIPEQMSGAETMAHRMAKFLVSKGHEVTVLSQWPDKDLDGVKIRQQSARDIDYFNACDLVFTHLNQTADTFNKARFARKKIVHIAHNSSEYSTVRCRIPNNYVVYNSEWVKEKLGYKHESFVLYPPVDYRDFAGVDTKKAKYVTLINVNENKGGNVLLDLAERLPDVQFMGVEGGYYYQIKANLPNVKYVPQEKDIRKILAQTRILIVPSDYESWGQVGIEAASCGIPVIASHAKGLHESLGDAAFFADRDKIDDWCFFIESLQAKGLYEEMSKKAKQRAIELDPLPQLEAFNNWIEKIHKQPYV